jgi:hypothetical protein
MLWARSGGAPRRCTGTNSCLSDHRLAGADGTAINRLAGNRGTGSLGDAWARRCRRSRHRGPGRRTEFCDQIRPRRYHWTRHGLAGEGSRGGLTQWRSGMRTRGWRSRRRRTGTNIGPRTLNDCRAGNRSGHRRPRRGDTDPLGSRRHRLTRTGKNLAGTRGGGSRSGHRLDSWRSRTARRDHGYWWHVGRRSRRRRWRWRLRRGGNCGRRRPCCFGARDGAVGHYGRMNWASRQWRTNRSDRSRSGPGLFHYGRGHWWNRGRRRFLGVCGLRGGRVISRRRFGGRHRLVLVFFLHRDI